MDARSLTVAIATALAAATAGLGPLGSAHAEGRPGYGGALIGSLLGAPASLDPVRAASHAELTLIGLVCDTLYRIDDRGVRPHLALGEPELDDSGLWARIRVPRGVRFHDGRELAAADVASSLERARQSASAGWLLAPVRTVRAETDDVVVVQLRRPTPELPALLASPATAIVPAPSGADVLIGTGPFALTALDRAARSASLVAHAHYFAGRPYLDRLELRWYEDGDAEARAYEAGRVDVSLRGEVAFAGHRPRHPTASAIGPATVLAYVGFGQGHEALLADTSFRRALSLALDRESLRYIGTGEPVAPTVVPAPVALGAAPLPPAESRAQVPAARRELGGARAAALGVTLEILIDASRPDDRAIAEKVAAALLKLDVAATIGALDTLELARRVSQGTCDLYIGQLAAQTTEPAVATAAAFAVAGDAWPARALARRALGLADVEAAFRKRLPIIPLFHRAVRAHYRAELRGFGFGALGRPTFADLFDTPR